jgi:flagellar assembly protein FliH
MSVSPMIYPAVSGWSPGAAPVTGDALAASQQEGNAEPPRAAGEVSARMFLEEDIRQAEQVGRQKGIQEAFAQAKLEFDSALAGERESIGAALREFSKDQGVYFHNVEGEVVSLALAIVRKILKREAQVDPMLLSGMVRVALERIGAAQTIRMRVHPSHISAWRAYFESQKDMALIPELSGDSSLGTNACELETEMGTTELNLETQLKEIEVGLFDLLAQRPAPK